MATFTSSQCIERLGQWVEQANAKGDNSREAILKVYDRVIIEAKFFNYEDIQRFTYILTRTSCEWWIYPGDGCVQLRVRLF